MFVESPRSTKRKKSVTGFASKVFKESSVVAVSAILAADSNPRKIFRILVFLIFTAGFLYQCVKFLSYLFEYPTVVNIEIIKPTHYLTPAFTFCNFNQVKRSKFCKKFPDKCIVSDEEVCVEYPFYCSGNMTMMPKEKYFSDDEYFGGWLDMSDIGHELKDLFVSKKELRENATGPYLRAVSRYQDGSAQCYSLHSRIDSALEPILQERGYLWGNALFQFVFNPEENETFSPSAKPGVVFTIHSPFTAVNPFQNGIFLKAGYLYKITISMEEEILLPHPYKTDCMNYTAIWLKNNKTGPRSQEMCQELCLLETSHLLLNCTPSFALYPSKIKPCYIIDYVDMTEESVSTAEEMLESCKDKCKDDCYTLLYIKDIQETYIVPQWTKNNKKNPNPRLISVEIYFDDTEMLSLRYKPQYQQVEVFSYIGGFVGIWLGVSLVQIADILESLFRIFRYVFGKRTSVCR